MAQSTKFPRSVLLIVVVVAFLYGGYSVFGFIPQASVVEEEMQMAEDENEEESQQDDPQLCDIGPGSIANECSGSPVGAPCGGTDEYEGVCVEVALYCDCILPDGRRFEDAIDDPVEESEEEEIEAEE